MELNTDYDASEFLDEADFLEGALQNLPLNEVGAAMLDDVRARTPVRTGTLRDANEYSVIGHEQVVVDNPMDYAPFVEFGTRYMDPESFMYVDDPTLDKIDDIISRHIGE